MPVRRGCATRGEPAAIGRQAHDTEYVAKFAGRIGELFPRCPIAEQRLIAAHACQKYSGRVGRSAAAKDLDAAAVELAVQAHVRHAHTPYDTLLSRGIDRPDARAAVADRVARRMNNWRGDPA